MRISNSWPDVKRKEWAKQRQRKTEAQDLQDKPWRNEEVKKLEKKECRVELSALSAGESDECSVDVSLQTDKTRHCTNYMEKTEPLSFSSIPFAQVFFVISTSFFLKR